MYNIHHGKRSELLLKIRCHRASLDRTGKMQRALSEQPHDIRVATKTCNMEYIIGITWINLKHNSLGMVSYK